MRIRITFSKQGALRYTSQLDVHKIWERAARRAGLPLAYSQGYHPQPRLSIACALPLGFSARAEKLDMRLNQEMMTDEILKKLNEVLPAGIRVSVVEEVAELAPPLQTRIIAADYHVTLTPAFPADELSRRIETLLQTASLPRERRGKSYDLRPLIEQLGLMNKASTVDNPSQQIYMRLTSRQGATGRPEEVLEALALPSEHARIERVSLIFSQS